VEEVDLEEEEEEIGVPGPVVAVVVDIPAVVVVFTMVAVVAADHLMPVQVKLIHQDFKQVMDSYC
jgi:hypothetical protein